VGGVRMLRALGYDQVNRFHMNEGHAAFLILQLFDEQLIKTGARTIKTAHVDTVRRQFDRRTRQRNRPSKRNCPKWPTAGS